VDETTSVRQDAGEDGAARRALAQIHALALCGLTQANAELTRADEEGDWENWSLWRGYRRALLEMLAVTDKLALAEAADGVRRRGAVPDAGDGRGACG
jgi:hypothetical protein